MTRAKFRCTQITTVAYASKVGELVETPTVKLQAVTAGPDASAEDKAFWSATPNGSIELTITNPEAAGQFRAGREYYVAFEPAGDESA